MSVKNYFGMTAGLPDPDKCEAHDDEKNQFYLNAGMLDIDEIFCSDRKWIKFQRTRRN